MPESLDALFRVNRTIAVCILTLTALAVLTALSIGKPFIAPTVLGLLIALTLSPLVRTLECQGLSSELASGLVVLGVLAGLAGATYALLPSYEEWRIRLPQITETLRERFGEVEEKFEPVSETAEAVQEIADSAAGGGAGQSLAASSTTAGSGDVLSLAASAPAIAATILYVTLLVYFAMAERDRLHRGLVGLLAGWRRRRHLARALRDMRRSVSRYLLTITAINIGLGLASAIAFYLLGLPNAGLWGAALAILNFVPYLGPAIMTCVVFLVGFLSFETVEQALLPVAAQVTLNLIEGQLVTPIVVGKRMKQSPLATFFAVAFGAWLWGVIGALIATPALIVGSILFQRFELLPKARFAEAQNAERRPRSGDIAVEGSTAV